MIVDDCNMKASLIDVFADIREGTEYARWYFIYKKDKIMPGYVGI